MATKEIERNRTQTDRPAQRRTSTAIGDSVLTNPFALMRRMQDEFDRWWGEPGASAGWLPSTGRSSGSSAFDWAPSIDVFQRGNELVVRADVPGMSKDDIDIEIGEDNLTIRGERRQELEDNREGIYRSERSYGSFCRVVPLPQGTIGDEAKATFHNGVLEVVMPAPSPEVKRGRRIEIHDTAPEKRDAGGNKK
jgi:HSP20 family protein